MTSLLSAFFNEVILERLPWVGMGSGDGCLIQLRATALFRLLDNLLVDAQVIVGHAPRAEALFEQSATFVPVDRGDASDGFDGLLYALHNKPGHAVFDNLVYRSAAKSNYRRTARQSLYHYQAEWFRPVDGEQQRRCVAEKGAL